MELYGIEEHERDCGTSTYAEGIETSPHRLCWILTGADAWPAILFTLGLSSVIQRMTHEE
jgi:hypothetical protein